MTRSYKLKIFANKNKIKKLNNLLAFWRDQVNHKIKLFWSFDNMKSSYPPQQYCCGGKLVGDASVKSWRIVKGAKATEQKERPYFKGKEIDLDQCSAYIIPEFKTKIFDIWFKVISLTPRKRLVLPCKRTKIFNEAIKKGKLKKSFKLLKINDNYYIECYVEFPEVKKKNKNIVGIDVGLNKAIVTSDGKILGKELKDLRIRTKWRTYKRCLSPVKQWLNHYAKKLAQMYPDSDFAVEKLLFRGKKGRSKKFRRNNNNWPYMWLAKKLSELGHLKGFEVIKVNPYGTSIKCPLCGVADKANRHGELFQCVSCGHTEDADIVGAVNIKLCAERVAREPYVPLTSLELERCGRKPLKSEVLNSKFLQKISRR